MKTIPKTALILFPNQLFDPGHLPEADIVYLLEEPSFFGISPNRPIKFHKQKLVMHRASIRSYRDELSKINIPVELVELPELLDVTSFIVTLANKGMQHIKIFDVTDHRLEESIYDAVHYVKGDSFEIETVTSPGFILDKREVFAYFSNKKSYSFQDFYSLQRKSLNLLMDKHNKPIGGRWSFDTENRKKLPKGVTVPAEPVPLTSSYVEEAKTWVEHHHADNPGDMETFMWPTTRAEAKILLQNFLEERLENFGPYEDAIEQDSVLLFHSGISAPLNIGLLNPREVVAALNEFTQKHQTSLASTEAFIRQVVGWREYVRGIYDCRAKELVEGNRLGHYRKMNEAWWIGTTGIPPVDMAIKKAQKYAYTHHIERLMILGNAMLLSEIDPTEANNWFMAFFIDAYEWVMLPNVFGMSQYASGSIMTTKPYIGGSNYILKMSHFEKGPWTETMDGLYWQFVDKHKQLLSTNPRTSMMVSLLKKMPIPRKNALFLKATAFKKQTTK